MIVSVPMELNTDHSELMRLAEVSMGERGRERGRSWMCEREGMGGERERDGRERRERGNVCERETESGN